LAALIFILLNVVVAVVLIPVFSVVEFIVILVFDQNRADYNRRIQERVQEKLIADEQIGKNAEMIKNKREKQRNESKNGSNNLIS